MFTFPSIFSDPAPCSSELFELHKGSIGKCCLSGGRRLQRCDKIAKIPSQAQSLLCASPFSPGFLPAPLGATSRVSRVHVRNQVYFKKKKKNAPPPHQSRKSLCILIVISASLPPPSFLSSSPGRILQIRVIWESLRLVA